MKCQSCLDSGFFIPIINNDLLPDKINKILSDLPLPLSLYNLPSILNVSRANEYDEILLCWLYYDAKLKGDYSGWAWANQVSPSTLAFSRLIAKVREMCSSKPGKKEISGMDCNMGTQHGMWVASGSYKQSLAKS